MKIRFSKTLAAVLAATTLTAISGISALAADVKTTTTYTWGDASANVTVTSTVVDATNKGKQVTYLVASDPTATNGIKYIDQAMLDNTDGTATFTFSAAQNAIYGANVTAKFGSDAGIDMPDFAFVDGVDYYSNATTDCTLGDIVADATNKKTTIYGTLTGEATEYGIKVGEKEFPAMGTTDNGNGGLFAVVIYGWVYDANADTVTAYVK